MLNFHITRHIPSCQTVSLFLATVIRKQESKKILFVKIYLNSSEEIEANIKYTRNAFSVIKFIKGTISNKHSMLLKQKLNCLTFSLILLLSGEINYIKGLAFCPTKNVTFYSGHCGPYGINAVFIKSSEIL